MKNIFGVLFAAFLIAVISVYVFASYAIVGYFILKWFLPIVFPNFLYVFTVKQVLAGGMVISAIKGYNYKPSPKEEDTSAWKLVLRFLTPWISLLIAFLVLIIVF